VLYSLFSDPSKPKDVSNPFGKSDSQSLGAGLEVGVLQISGCGLGRRFAEYRQ
jgi:hypothetical protein